MSEMQTHRRRDGFGMSDDFMWLVGPFDLSPISEKLGKPRSEIYAQLCEDVMMRVVRVYYIPDGTSRTFPYSIERRRPHHVLEKVFLEELRQRPLEWEDVWASVIRETWADTTWEHFNFYLETAINGEVIHTRYYLPVHDVITSHLEQDDLFKIVWQDMIDELDHGLKRLKYGPR